MPGRMGDKPCVALRKGINSQATAQAIAGA